MSKRNLECKVEIHIKIKKVNKSTKRNDPKYLKRDIPLKGVIIIKGQHNHPIENHESLQYLRVTEETKKIFYGYFNDNMGASEAKRLHEDTLRMREDWPIVQPNTSLNPSDRQVTYLHELWRQSEFGADYGVDPLAKLKEKADQYAKDGIMVHIDEDSNEGGQNWAVLVVTPIMLRTHATKAAGEIIFVDSTASVESTESSTTVMLAATGAGAIPLGIFIHGSQTTSCYTKAFNLMKQNYPNCFGGKTNPEVFMTDYSNQEKDALSALWNESLQFLCHFHVAQAHWRWLMESKHDVSKDERRDLMTRFQGLMYAIDTETFEEAKDNFMNCNHEKYIKHVDTWLEFKEEWVQMFRADILYRGHNTNNYAEATIRVLKDIILERTKAFNVTAMVNFIAVVWEAYFECKLLHFAYGQKSGPYKKYERLTKKMPEGAAELIQKVDTDFYLVPNEKLVEASYEVDGRVGWCSCPAGRGGAFCKHQCLVQKVYGGLFPNKPAIDAKSRYELGKLALGEKCPPFSFFIGLKEKVTEESMETIENSTELHETFSNSDKTTTPNENTTATESEITSENVPEINVKLREDFNKELQRIHDLGQSSPEHNEIYEKAMTRLMKRLKRVHNPAQASLLMLSLSASAYKNTQRCGDINVQVTATSRRRPGVTRGCKRLKAGRPKGAEPPAKKAKRAAKLPRNIASHIKANKAHITKH
ncbi:hypothetical protein FOCC_FOCC012784 [Frankliniella occidentalis]|nr:hypothetical protein FOCC_FOCC012784 [Frankliniella occidentalis]